MVLDCEQPAKAVMPIAIKGRATRNNFGEFIPFRDSSAKSIHQLTSVTRAF